MRFRQLGNAGLRVSAVGLGCNNFGMRCDAEQSRAVVHAALENGINFFDTADVYGGQRSEELLGAALAGNARQNVLIATKFGNPLGEGNLERGASRHHVMQAAEASLRRLNTDYIDLYQLHIPDVSTPIEETLRALDDLVRSGKVRYLGNSNFTGWQIADADWTARYHGLNRFVTAQNHYNLLDRRAEREVIPACRHYGLGLLPYFPLASGLLTGKYTRGREAPSDSRLANFGERGKRALSDENFDRVEALSEFAGRHDRTVLELAMSWLAGHEQVASVIAGATTPAQIAANVAAAHWSLDADTRAEVDELTRR